MKEQDKKRFGLDCSDYSVFAECRRRLKMAIHEAFDNKMYSLLCKLLLCATLAFIGVNADHRCSAREIIGHSVVCVCNATYCDETKRENPAQGQFVKYTSSESGHRFLKEVGELTAAATGRCDNSLTLDNSTTYQTIEGFGGATTDSAAINWKILTDPRLQKKLIDAYYSNAGLQYSMVRVPIGGSDFSTHPYAYNEFPINDVHLTNFSLSYEDFEYKIPMIKSIMATATTPVHIVATTWSPPPWMKTNNQYAGVSRLKPEYYQTYADYHIKFLEKYAAEGIPIWGITTTNEPIDGVLGLVAFNTLGWTPAEMGYWIVNHLGPTVKKSTFKDLKIITVDDQRILIPIWLNMMVEKYPKVLQYIDGVGVHFYTDMIVPASVLSYISRSYPDKFILATEASEGSAPWQTEKVVLGSWYRAKSYIIDIIADLNHNVVGWIDWNLCLNAQGGPNWVKNYVDAPIIVYPERKEFIKQPLYYALGHFSKFIPRGSKRIKVTDNNSNVENVAFITPNNTLVVVLYNNSNKEKSLCLIFGRKKAKVSIATKTVVTVELPLH